MAIALPLGDARHRALHVALALGDDRERAPLVLARLPGLRLGLVEVRVEIPRVHASEDLSGLHHVALTHRDGGDPPRPLGGDVVLRGLDAAVARREAGGERGTPKSLHQLCRAMPGLGRVREERPQAPSPRKSSAHTAGRSIGPAENDHVGFGGGFHHACLGAQWCNGRAPRQREPQCRFRTGLFGKEVSPGLRSWGGRAPGEDASTQGITPAGQRSIVRPPVDLTRSGQRRPRSPPGTGG